jgi:hypothetical protein
MNDTIIQLPDGRITVLRGINDHTMAARIIVEDYLKLSPSALTQNAQINPYGVAAFKEYVPVIQEECLEAPKWDAPVARPAPARKSSGPTLTFNDDEECLTPPQRVCR